MVQARHALHASEVAARVSVIEGNFFEQVPQGFDAYLLSHVLHDWTDEQSITILAALPTRHSRSRASADRRSDLPEGDAPHHGKLMDLLMLTVTGGRERTADEFATLLAAADFKLTRIVPTVTHQSLVEAQPA